MTTATQMSFPTIKTTYKKCSRCGEIKPLTEYYRAAGCLDGHYSYCKVCRKNNVPNKEWQERKELLERGLRRCKKCNEVKPLDDFYKDTVNYADGYLSSCKPCIIESQYPGAAMRKQAREEWWNERDELGTKNQRRCKKCKRVYPLDDFYIDKNHQRENTCQYCIRERQSPGSAARKKQQQRLRDVGLKRCSQCKNVKPRSEFYVNSQRPGHCLPQCKACSLKTGKEWRKRRPRKQTIYWHRYRARKYGAPGKHTDQDIERLYEEQEALCTYRQLNPNCHQSLDENAYHIDHIMPLSRGGSNGPENLQLLCPHCNISKSNRAHEEYLSWLDMVYG